MSVLVNSKIYARLYGSLMNVTRSLMNESEFFPVYIYIYKKKLFERSIHFIKIINVFDVFFLHNYEAFYGLNGFRFMPFCLENNKVWMTNKQINWKRERDESVFFLSIFSEINSPFICNLFDVFTKFNLTLVYRHRRIHQIHLLLDIWVKGNQLCWCIGCIFILIPPI